MSTLGDLEKRIYREIHKTLSVDVRNAVMDSVKYYQDKRFWFNEAQTSFNITASSVYALSTVIPKCINIDYLKVYLGDVPYEVCPANWNDIERMDNETGSASTPTDYAIHHEMLRLYPKPNTTTSMVALYHKQITLSSSASASTAWTNEAADLIRHRAKAMLYAGVLLDSAQAQVENTLESMALNRLFSRSAKLLGGKLKKYL